MELKALGIDFRGFLASPAHIEMYSGPAMTKAAPIMQAKKPWNFPRDPTLMYSFIAPGSFQYLKGDEAVQQMFHNYKIGAIFLT